MADLNQILWDVGGVFLAKTVMGRKSTQKQLLVFSALDFAYETWGKDNLPKLLDEKQNDAGNITAKGEANINKVVYIVAGEYFFGGKEGWMNRALDTAVGLVATSYIQQ